MTGKARFLVVFLLLAVTSLYMNLHSDMVVPMNRPLEAFPRSLDGWRMVSQMKFGKEVLNVLKPTDYLSRTYEGSGERTVELYIGYDDGGKDSGEIHSPKHCLPGSGWYESSSRQTKLDVDGARINLVRAVYIRGDVKELFYYWYQVGGRTLSDEYSLKLAQISDSIFHRRRDAAFVRISIPVQTDGSRSSAFVIEFIRDFYPVIKKFLPA